jgi:hypothetical protein
VGQAVNLSTSVRYGAQPVRGWVTLWSSTDGTNWTTVANMADVGSDGTLVTTARPNKSTYYQVAVSASSASGWTAPGNAIVYVAVAKWPVRLSSTAKAGRPDVLTGRLTVSANGNPLAGRSLKLQKRLAGSSRWTTVTTRTTGSTGYVKASVQPRRRTYYRWVYAGSPTYRPLTSPSAYVSY